MALKYDICIVYRVEIKLTIKNENNVIKYLIFLLSVTFRPRKTQKSWLNKVGAIKSYHWHFACTSHGRYKVV